MPSSGDRGLIKQVSNALDEPEKVIRIVTLTEQSKAFIQVHYLTLKDISVVPNKAPSVEQDLR